MSKRSLGGARGRLRSQALVNHRRNQYEKAFQAYMDNPTPENAAWLEDRRRKMQNLPGTLRKHR